MKTNTAPGSANPGADRPYTRVDVTPDPLVTQPAPASLLTIFGATGDLARRMLLPSLYSLQAERLLPDGMRILGTARSELDREAFVAEVEASICERIPAHERDAGALRGLLERLDYQAAAVDDDASMAALAACVQALRNGDVLYHLSTAPRFYGPACQALAAHGAAGPGTRVMLEKPIGKDLASAVAINDSVARAFDEDRIYRVDHYLGKEGVQNLIALRFGNALFEPLWNARHIEQVQITVGETVGVEGRGDYYDDSGAMRDMLQNHLLQLLCLVAMEPPARFEPTAVRNEKIKVLRSLRAIGAHEVAAESVAGQYGAGAIDGVAVPGYAQELGRESRTETFVALRAHIDNWRWSGVPFYLRTGKRLPSRSTEIYIQFRKVPYSIFGGRPAADLRPNGLGIKLQPEDAFGDYDAELVAVEPRSLFPDNIEVGMQFERATEDGDDGELYMITDIADDKVVVDGNHPLAGMALIFSCTVAEVRQATDDEIGHGHIHGPGSHHHH